MANLKTLLASLLDSFIKTSSTKALMSEAASINIGSIVTNQANGSIAPFDGYVVVQLITDVNQNQSGYFIYVGGSSVGNGLCMFGLRGVTNANELVRYFSPCKKGEYVFYDGAGSNVNLNFVPFSGFAS